MNKFVSNLKRMGFEACVLVGLGALIFFLPLTTFPEEAKLGLFSLFVTKFLLVSAGLIHAHIARQLFFPYIRFRDEKEFTNNIMIIALYVVIIFAWSRGG